MMATNRIPPEVALFGRGKLPPAAPLVVEPRQRQPGDVGLPCAPDPDEAERLAARQQQALQELEARPDMRRRRWISKP